MGFVKSAAEIARIQHALANPRFVDAHSLTVEFLSDRLVLESVLPPGFALAGEPVAFANVGRFRSNCVGDFEGGSISIPATFNGHTAAYVLAMYMSTDHAIVYGRDLFGEPKKQAGFGLHKSGNRASAYIERHGVKLVEMEADLHADLGPSEGARASFNIKAQPHATGVGLAGDAEVTKADFATVTRGAMPGTGRLVLRSTALDPLADLPVLAIRSAVWWEGDVAGTVGIAGAIPAKDFEPYFYGRNDDWSLLNTEDRADGSPLAKAAE